MLLKLRVSISLAMLSSALLSTTSAQNPLPNGKSCRNVNSLHLDYSEALGSDQNPFRVGNNGVTPPVLMYHPGGTYTQAAIKAHYGGTVLIFVIVDTNGCPGMIKIARALGMGLDESAIDAVKKWRWRPATKNGNAVAVRTYVEMTFTVPKVATTQ